MATAAAEASNANNERDTMLKIREDPIFAIKKREKDAVTDIVSNPLKMRQLREVLGMLSFDLRAQYLLPS